MIILVNVFSFWFIWNFKLVPDYSDDAKPQTLRWTALRVMVACLKFQNWILEISLSADYTTLY